MRSVERFPIKCHLNPVNIARAVEVAAASGLVRKILASNSLKASTNNMISYQHKAKQLLYYVMT